MSDSPLADEIAAEAAAAKATSVEGTTVTRRDLRELIEADKHLSANEGVASPNRGLRFNKLSPPGTA